MDDFSEKLVSAKSVRKNHFCEKCLQPPIFYLLRDSQCEYETSIFLSLEFSSLSNFHLIESRVSHILERARKNFSLKISWFAMLSTA